MKILRIETNTLHYVEEEWLEDLTILEMVCRHQKLPMRKELCKKLLKDQDQRGKTISIEGIGALCEGLGCQTQIGAVKPEHLNSVDYPALK